VDVLQNDLFVVGDRHSKMCLRQKTLLTSLW
jgi:hypothetical protein